MKKRKLIACMCAMMVFMTSVKPIYAVEENSSNEETEESMTAPYTLPVTSETSASITLNDNGEESLILTVDDAVGYGLENSTIIDTFDNKIELAALTGRVMEGNYRKLDDSEEVLDEVEETIEEKQDYIYNLQGGLSTAIRKFEEEDIAPKAITTEFMGQEVTLVEKGMPIMASLEALEPQIIAMAAAYGVTLPTGYITGKYDKIVSNIQNGFIEAQQDIDEGQVKLNEGKASYELGLYQYNHAIETASDEIDDILGYTSVVAYDNLYELKDLMVNVAGVNFDVTRYAKEIYRNQIAMLIQKNYYDALYAGKIVELKEIAMARGEEQYNAVSLSYENGMKSKDDYLLSKMYYDGTVIAHRLAVAEYNNALCELKKNINMPMDTEITLVDVMSYEVTEVSEKDFQGALESGLTNRIEIQQVLGTLMLQELNRDIIEKMIDRQEDDDDDDDDDDLDDDALFEAELLVEGQYIALEQTKQQVTSDIYQSYELMVATGEMLEDSEELIANAEEVVAIAQLKYDQGFGADNSLLTSLNLESSSGTMIELIAAQENLADIEAQVAQIYYSYTMATINYYNNAAILTY